MLSKVCTGCLLEKPVTAFSKQKDCKFGVTTRCKDCYKAYRSNPEVRARHLKSMRRWQKKNRAKMRRDCRAWYKKNRRYAIERSAAWQRKNIDKSRKWQRDYHNKMKSDPAYLKRKRATRRVSTRKNRTNPKACAARAVGLAVLCGLLPKLPCEVCHSVFDVQGHHHKGYDLVHWFSVQWLCRAHHWEAHNALKDK